MDPYCILDAGKTSEPTASTLSKLLPAWGVTLSSGQVVADLEFEARSPEGRAPSLLDLAPEALNPADVLTSGLDTLLLAFAGALTVSTENPSNLQREVLDQGQWKLPDAKSGEAINPNTLYFLLTHWSAPAFFDIATDPQSADFTESAMFTIHDQNGESVIYEIGKSTGAASPVKVHPGDSPEAASRWKDRIFWVDARLIAAIPTSLAGMQAGGTQPLPPAPPNTP